MNPKDEKVVTLGSLQAAVDKIKADFATKTYVTEQVNAGSVDITYATTEEVLALFNEPTQEGGETV